VNPPAAGLELWGSDCRHCGNTTPEMMVCDECHSDRFTVALWVVAVELDAKDEAADEQQAAFGVPV
jgi:hypothetical protein